MEQCYTKGTMAAEQCYSKGNYGCRAMLQCFTKAEGIA